MDREGWEKQLKLLEELLVTKKKEIEKQNSDVEEIEYTIECYKKKISEFPLEVTRLTE